MDKREFTLLCIAMHIGAFFGGTIYLPTFCETLVCTESFLTMRKKITLPVKYLGQWVQHWILRNDAFPSPHLPQVSGHPHPLGNPTHYWHSVPSSSPGPTWRPHAASAACPPVSSPPSPHHHPFIPHRLSIPIHPPSRPAFAPYPSLWNSSRLPGPERPSEVGGERLGG